MPIRAQHPCAYPGCAQLVTGSRYCGDCQRVIRQAYERDHPRSAEDRQSYGPAWRKLSRAYLKVHPWCADPFGDHAKAGQSVASTEADHVMPKKLGGRDEWANLQALCKSCHSRKSAVEGSRWSKGEGVQKVYNFSPTADGATIRTHARNWRAGSDE